MSIPAKFLPLAKSIFMHVTRNFDLLDYAKLHFPSRPMLGEKKQGQWITYSILDYQHTVNHLSYALLDWGFKAGDRAAIMSFNCPQWNFSDLAISQVGGISVPLYTTLAENDLAYILNDAEVCIAFVQNEAMGQSIKNAKPDIHIVCFEEGSTFLHWETFAEGGRKAPAIGKLQGIKDSIKPGDLMTLIYTSGTTGMPKGVMLSHENVLSNVNVCEKLYPEFREKTVLSFLPLCHIFERMVGYLYLKLGATIYYAENMESIADNLKEVKPFAFTTVPRLLEKVYDKIVAKGHTLGGIKKALFFWALNLGLRYELGNKNTWIYRKQLAIADRLIFSKWREALGGKVEVIVCGAAALQSRLARVFTAAGISVLEGYGLTETSPVIAVNRLQHNGRMFGSVGPLIPGVEVNIAPDGEILCKGPNVMLGYYKQPELTAEVLSPDGWLRTGDIGTFTEERFLKITDRKKEIFKTSGGKYIAPQRIENKLKESMFIEQAMVVGENQKYAAALIVPSFASLNLWAENNQISSESTDSLVNHPNVQRLFESEIATCNAEFGQWEHIKRFHILPLEWTIANAELTPTLKLRRKNIYQNFQKEIDSLFN
jgi:long-chain acyl-CoA synthetase